VDQTPVGVCRKAACDQGESEALRVSRPSSVSASASLRRIHLLPEGEGQVIFLPEGEGQVIFFVFALLPRGEGGSLPKAARRMRAGATLSAYLEFPHSRTRLKPAFRVRELRRPARPTITRRES
jgi:hypothetical protein